MKTSKEWWETIKQSPEALNDWLVKQYRGEVTAAARIRALTKQYISSPKAERILETIAVQEEQHASWVLDLLQSRGLTPKIVGAEDRYWDKTLPGIESFETGCAVAAHAEKMRLERIKVISEDAEAPAQLRGVFKLILKDELWHEEAFRSLATSEALEKTRGNHELGLSALGLVA